MLLAQAILIAMMTLPCPADEPKEQCEPWRASVASAIEQAAEEAACDGEWTTPGCVPVWNGPTDELAAYLLEIAYHESGLRRRIQEGTCRDDECDSTWRWKGGKRRHTGHLAQSMWQIHQTPVIPGLVAPRVAV